MLFSGCGHQTGSPHRQQADAVDARKTHQHVYDAAQDGHVPEDGGYEVESQEPNQ